MLQVVMTGKEMFMRKLGESLPGVVQVVTGCIYLMMWLCAQRCA